MNCKHEQTFPLEPTWTNKRKCIDCGMVYEPGREILWMKPPGLPPKIDAFAERHYSERKDLFCAYDFKAGVFAMYTEHERIVKPLLDVLEACEHLVRHSSFGFNGHALEAQFDKALEDYKWECGE